MKATISTPIILLGSIAGILTCLCAHAQTGNTIYGTEFYYNISGKDNTLIGFDALFSNTRGNDNTAIGYSSIEGNTTGSQNTGLGMGSLFSNTTGSFNTASGFEALYLNTTGYQNSAFGLYALFSTTTGYCNTAAGSYALALNQTGYLNTATGNQALKSNTTGSGNTATGSGALLSNISGSDNEAFGEDALNLNSSGSSNTALGVGALESDTAGNGNIGIGYMAGSQLSTGSSDIYVGNGGVNGENGVIRVGMAGTQTETFVAGIAGVGVSGSPVVVSSTGQLGVAPSSRRFKRDITDMGSASEAILALRPVTFRYKPEVDPKGTPQYGLVAEEVAKISPDLVTHDAGGQIYTVRYDAVNAMLLNEFRKQHERVEGQSKTISELQAEVAALTARLDTLDRASADK